MDKVDLSLFGWPVKMSYLYVIYWYDVGHIVIRDSGQQLLTLIEEKERWLSQGAQYPPWPASRIIKETNLQVYINVEAIARFNKAEYHWQVERSH